MTTIVDMVKDNAIHQTFYGSLLTLLTYTYGLISTPLFWVLIGFCSIDYILGIYAAFKKKELDVDIALDGIVKKFYYGVLILLSAFIDFTLMYLGINTQGLFHNFIMATLLSRELGSIAKNANKGGLWVPKMIKDAQKTIDRYVKENTRK